ncbi:MAG: hypothetical protein Q8O67_16855 [Deltaproteobacteria bacterium]|nr:hypothetical protein [Deltaproteobacteria bacterium]
MLRVKVGFVIFIVAAVAGVFASRAYRSGVFGEELIARGCEESPETRSLSTTYANDAKNISRKVETWEVKASRKTWEMVVKELDGTGAVEVTSVKEIKQP